KKLPPRTNAPGKLSVPSVVTHVVEPSLAARGSGVPAAAPCHSRFVRSRLAIDGKELTNGYSELKIPEEQQARFQREADAAAHGDLEAHTADRCFVRTLEYGLPPTSGIGIGVDRLVMLLAEVEAIRDVILFPTMRPEAGT